mmetsp:Transcript_5675/g.7057  ORF Transcript_5675/g.7057 Transcript_5675/m.7057 type:complete len:148 (+) Transcript_5675:3-446(+)
MVRSVFSVLCAFSMLSVSLAQYQMMMNVFLEGYSPLDNRIVFDNIGAAKLGCDKEYDCGGITREPNGDFTLRKGSGGMVKKSNVGEVSWVKSGPQMAMGQSNYQQQQQQQQQQQRQQPMQTQNQQLDEEASALDMLPDLASLVSSLK